VSMESMTVFFMEFIMVFRSTVIIASLLAKISFLGISLCCLSQMIHVATSTYSRFRL
jgi:hypothetical protein